jgi:hypothetical protein
MSDPPPEERPLAPAEEPVDGPGRIARLLSEIRGDAAWRERVASLAQAIEPAPAPPRTLAAQELDPSLSSIVAQLAAAAEQARQEPPIEPGRPFVGDVWARLRQLIRSEIASYQARQSVVNGEATAALQRLVAALDPIDPGSALGAVWAELARLDQSVADLERRLARLEGSAPTSRLDAVEGIARALASEVEPLGSLRATVAELEARLDRLERGSAR